MKKTLLDVVFNRIKILKGRCGPHFYIQSGRQFDMPELDSPNFIIVTLSNSVSEKSNA